MTCFPELATTYYFPGFAEALVEHLFHEEPFPTLAPVAEAARRLGLYILLPIPEKSGLSFYNSALLFGPGGEVVGRYRKNLLPGSFLKSESQLNVYEKIFFRPGDLGLSLFDVAGAKVGVQICYERQFPEGFRALALKGAQVIFAPSNSQTYDTDWRKTIWYCLFQTRAYENGVFIVAVNKAGRERGIEWGGHSMVVSPLGAEILADAGAEEDCVLTVTLDLGQVVQAQHRLPFARDLRPEIYPWKSST